MGIRVCPNCGNSYVENEQESMQKCKNCGFILVSSEDVPMFTKKRMKKLTSKTRMSLLICTVIAVCIALFISISIIHKQSTLRDIETLVQNGKYLEAYSLIDRNLLDAKSDNDAVQIAWTIGNLERTYEYAKKSSSNKIDFYTSVVVSAIGDHQQFLDWELYDYVEPMVLDSIQQIENLREKPWDGTTEQIIYKKYNDPDNSLSEPYRTTNPDGAKEYIDFLLSTIDYDQAEQIEKEKYNQQNPLQITDKSTRKEGNYWYCEGTLSNVSINTYYYVKVKVTYYDSNMKILTTDWTYAVDSVGIDGGENKQFEIMTKVTGDVAKYKVEVIDYQ